MTGLADSLGCLPKSKTARLQDENSSNYSGNNEYGVWIIISFVLIIPNAKCLHS